MVGTPLEGCQNGKWTGLISRGHAATQRVRVQAPYPPLNSKNARHRWVSRLPWQSGQKCAQQKGPPLALISVYNEAVDNPIPKVPKAQFDAVLLSLLGAAPMPMAGIPRKREAKQTKPTRPNAKKRG